MSTTPPTAPPQRSKRWWWSVLGSALVVALLLTFADIAMIRIARDIVDRETQTQIKALAQLAAHHLDPQDIAAIHSPSDITTPQFNRLFKTLQRIRSTHPDILYIYVLRYSGQQDLWHFVVDADAFATDQNDNGTIDPEEESIPPGKEYRAKTKNPVMLDGLKRSVVDPEPRDDPPWGTLISAHAPLRSASGETIALLGIDAQYDQVQAKIRVMEIAIISFSALIGFMVLYAVYLFQRRSEALSQSVELQKQLETVKAQFSKFVPENVRRELERNPDAVSLKRTEMDISVMFVDIAGFTRMSERLAGDQMGALLERYFSQFLKIIHEFHGEINETAGDGLMVLFKHNPPNGHALDAVLSAFQIQRAAASINADAEAQSGEAIRVNIGINSGTAFVGLNRFTSLSGDRYTYTATGSTTNIAARVAGLAQGGDIILSEWTAQRLGQKVLLEEVGQRALKNVSKPVTIFRPKPLASDPPIPPSAAV